MIIATYTKHLPTAVFVFSILGGALASCEAKKDEKNQKSNGTVVGAEAAGSGAAATSQTDMDGVAYGFLSDSLDSTDLTGGASATGLALQDSALTQTLDENEPAEDILDRQEFRDRIAQLLFEIADDDKSGGLTEAEFANFRLPQSFLTAEEIAKVTEFRKKLFTNHNTDGDATLSLEEARNLLLAQRDVVRAYRREKRIDHMEHGRAFMAGVMQRYDKNGDKVLDEQERLAMNDEVRNRRKEIVADINTRCSAPGAAEDAFCKDLAAIRAFCAQQQDNKLVERICKNVRTADQK